jgi:methylglyoxal synthase
MQVKKIGLVAHDGQKKNLKEWVEWNKEILVKYDLVCTGTTGKIIKESLSKCVEKEYFDKHFTILKSGPLGGDQQLGAMIVNGDIQMLIFFWDPMESQPHDVDVKALLRITTMYNVPAACNRATADFLISSPLLDEEYECEQQDFSAYANRKI